jgi:hypothetical protein
MKGIATASLRLCIAGFALLLSFATAGAQPPGTAFDPTHYWTYHSLQPVDQPQPIFVKDQFFRGGIPVTVDRLDRFLNWVHKNNSAVPDTFLHYTWWNIIEKVPVNRAVIVTNQFGSHIVQVLNLEFLLAPAAKNDPAAAAPPVAPLANHYLCYRAVGFPSPPAGYDLVDEWKVDFQHPQDMEFLCTPCLKEHNGRVFPPVDTVTHLAAYPVTPQSPTFFPFVADQFIQMPLPLTQQPLEYLFVPSEKTELPTDVKRSTWGKIKSLYR